MNKIVFFTILSVLTVLEYSNSEPIKKQDLSCCGREFPPHNKNPVTHHKHNPNNGRNRNWQSLQRTNYQLNDYFLRLPELPVGITKMQPDEKIKQIGERGLLNGYKVFRLTDGNAELDARKEQFKEIMGHLRSRDHHGIVSRSAVEQLTPAVKPDDDKTEQTDTAGADGVVSAVSPPKLAAALSPALPLLVNHQLKPLPHTHLISTSVSATLNKERPHPEHPELTVNIERGGGAVPDVDVANGDNIKLSLVPNHPDSPIILLPIDRDAQDYSSPVPL